MADPVVNVARLRSALTEVMARRDAFSPETYTQIVMALYDRIRTLQTLHAEPQVKDSDEIRLVTVIFVDVINSTELARRLQAETWKKIISDSHTLLSRIVRKWGGEIGQYLGDGLLCFFGAQHSQEDDALRAVHAALEAQAAIEEFASQINKEYQSTFSHRDQNNLPIPFAIRIGMSTGQVVVGMVGDAEKQELVAMGATTNLAARLQSLCEPGRVLIDAQTYHRVRDHFIMEARQITQLKGFEEPVECYTVIDQRQAEHSWLVSSRIAGLETPFVGRDAELHQLLAVCQQALHENHFHIVIVTGEVGIGKSRLLKELLHHVDSLPFTLFVMTASYEKRNIPHSFIHDLLAERCNLKDDTPKPAAEERILRYVRKTWHSSEAEPTAHILGFIAGYGFTESPHVRALKLSGAEQRQVTFTRITQWFRAWMQIAPPLFLVDNLQWLDADSLDLLEHLAHNLPDHTGVLIGAVRPEFTQERTHYLAGHPQHIRLPLHRLNETDISTLLDAILSHVDNKPERLPQLIRQRAEGNPLFVEGFLQMLFDYGVFEMTENGRWKADRLLYATLESQLPNSLLGLLQARLDELSPVARRIAQVAAVIGQTFWEGAVTAVSGSEHVQSELAILQNRGIIVQRAESVFEQEREYGFQHSLYREVAYAMLIRPTRKAYHQGVALWLEQHVAVHPDYLDVLAEHYMKAEQPEQALSAYLSSVISLLERGWLLKTLRNIERGWDIARSVSREFALPIVSQLWRIRGQALEALDEYEEASAASETALMLLEELPADEMIEERVTAALTLGISYTHLGQYTQALETLKHAHTVLPKEHTRLHAAVLRAFGVLYRARGQLNESLAYQQQAYTLAQECEDEREIARVMSMLGSIALDRGNFAAALDYYERVLEMNRQDGNLYYQIIDLSQLAAIHRLLFDYETALMLCQQAEEIQAQIHYQHPFIRLNQGLSLMARGDIQEGLALLQENSQQRYQNVYTRQRIQLALLHGLVLAGDYAAYSQYTSNLLAETAQHSLIVYGRALLWQGVAQNALNSAEAYDTLLQAAEHETLYGGRDLWLCYLALSYAAPAEAERRSYHEQALQTLQATAASLHSHPGLQASVQAYRLRLAASEH